MAAIEQKLAPPKELERLFMAYHVRVLKAAYRITGSMADAEDVVQTVFLRLATPSRAGTAGANPGEFDHAGQMLNPESYLYRAGINAALDLLRKRQAENTAPFGATAPAVTHALPDHDYELAEMRSWLRQALAKLGPRAAEMFVLRYLEDFDNRQIARILKTSPAVVAVILYRTRARLRNDLQMHMRGRK